MRYRLRILWFVGTYALGSVSTGLASASQDHTVVVGGHLITGTGDVVEDAAVLIVGGTIRAIGKREALVVPAGSAQVDATGKWLIPGLIDMHVHYRDWMADLFVRHGVTTVRDVGNNLEEVLRLRADSRRPDARGPRLFTCGPLLDGSSPRWGPTISASVTNPTEARATARLLIGRRVDCLKVYERLTRDLIQVVVEEGQKAGIPVTGHLRETALAAAVDAGIRGLEHGSGIDYAGCVPARLTEARALILRAGVFVVPTLVQMEQLSRLASPAIQQTPFLTAVPVEARQWWDTPYGIREWTPERSEQASRRLACKQQFVSALDQAGGRIVAGSDTPNPYVVPGISLHRELKLLVDAGLTPSAALSAATRTAAAFLGQSSRLGTLEAGKTADLVILWGNPLADIDQLSRVHLVIRDGRVVWKQ